MARYLLLAILIMGLASSLAYQLGVNNRADLIERKNNEIIKKSDKIIQKSEKIEELKDVIQDITNEKKPGT